MFIFPIPYYNEFKVIKLYNASQMCYSIPLWVLAQMKIRCEEWAAYGVCARTQSRGWVSIFSPAVELHIRRKWSNLTLPFWKFRWETPSSKIICWSKSEKSAVLSMIILISLLSLPCLLFRNVPIFVKHSFIRLDQAASAFHPIDQDTIRYDMSLT